MSRHIYSRPDKTRQEAAWYLIDNHGLQPVRLLKREVGNEMNRSKEISSLSIIDRWSGDPSHGCTAKLSCWPQQHTSGSKPIREALHTMSTPTNSLRVHRPFETVGAARRSTGTDVEGQPKEASLGRWGHTASDGRSALYQTHSQTRRVLQERRQKLAGEGLTAAGNAMLIVSSPGGITVSDLS